MALITVACVLKLGGIYDRSWVERLQRAVARHLRAPHVFVCLSDDKSALRMWDEDIVWKPLQHDWPGWWSKIETYALPGRVLYLDLDVAVVGSLDDLLDTDTEPFDGRSFEPEGTFTAIRDFYRPDEFNTSVMLIENRRDIYEAFVEQSEAVMAAFRGDQEWLTVIVPEARLWTSGIASYRKHCRARLHLFGKPPSAIPAPPGTSVVCFHGQPKMPDAEGWPAEYWAA